MTTANSILREYHRRMTHFQARPDLTPLAAAQVQGELIGLRGALGISLGGEVQGGEADRLAAQKYQSWVTSTEAQSAACTCVLCKSEVGQMLASATRQGGDAT
ncbi:hypothetical protein [Streptomyces rubiginosohelvolus]|uniref:Uncharacterized protein n=1 Tax=Streptomyces rubiginosohelvolus TaxID=67362 RepID=A0ABQ3CBS2_9ACTN|nr:hypothetical protein [Streptomyces pluricolorescens]GGZ82296.1 hypothetical protein GCM10010328_66030 [Streptomyces pluricolorescens]